MLSALTSGPLVFQQQVKAPCRHLYLSKEFTLLNILLFCQFSICLLVLIFCTAQVLYQDEDILNMQYELATLTTGLVIDLVTPLPSLMLFPTIVTFTPKCCNDFISYIRTKTTNLNDGPYNPTLPQPQWHPKISPYRFISFLTPLVIGTVKAVSSLKGNVTTPTTLEWISGLVIFLV